MLFCQDKEIGVGAMERKRIEYIDWLRIITNFPLLGIGFAIPLLWFIVFLLSWGATFIMLKIPGLKDLL